LQASFSLVIDVIHETDELANQDQDQTGKSVQKLLTNSCGFLFLFTIYFGFCLAVWQPMFFRVCQLSLALLGRERCLRPMFFKRLFAKIEEVDLTAETSFGKFFKTL